MSEKIIQPNEAGSRGRSILRSQRPPVYRPLIPEHFHCCATFPGNAGGQDARGKPPGNHFTNNMLDADAEYAYGSRFFRLCIILIIFPISVISCRLKYPICNEVLPGSAGFNNGLHEIFRFICIVALGGQYPAQPAVTSLFQNIRNILTSIAITVRI